MTLNTILDALGVENYRDRNYVRKVLSIYSKKSEAESFTSAIQSGLDRDYSTFKKRAKNIVTSTKNENLKAFLNIDKNASGKEFIEKIAEKVKNDDSK